MGKSIKTTASLHVRDTKGGRKKDVEAGEEERVEETRRKEARELKGRREKQGHSVARTTGERPIWYKLGL